MPLNINQFANKTGPTSTTEIYSHFIPSEEDTPTTSPGPIFDKTGLTESAIYASAGSNFHSTAPKEANAAKESRPVKNQFLKCYHYYWEKKQYARRYMDFVDTEILSCLMKIYIVERDCMPNFCLLLTIA